MKKLFTIGETFIFYDEPLVFALRDEIGGSYVGLLGDEDVEGFAYAAFPVSPKLLTAFAGGRYDLLHAIQQSYRGYWYGFNDLNRATFESDIQYSEALPEDYIPAPGLVLEPIEDSNEEIVAEATLRDRTIMHFAMSDDRDRHSITLNNLSAFALSFQKVIENIYKKVIKGVPDAAHLRSPENYHLRAFAFSRGSFKLHLEAGGMADMFDHSAPIVDALKVFHEFIVLGNDEGQEPLLIEKLGEYKGHSISNLKKFLSQMLERGIEIKYKWYSPGGGEVSDAVISLDYARKVFDLLELRAELSSTIKVFTGRVRGASSLTGQWAIEDADEGIVKGTAAQRGLLSSVEIDDVYKFTCEEVIQVEAVSGKEIVSYELIGKLRIS